MPGYTIVDRVELDNHITFMRINPQDIALTLKDVFQSISDLSWISEFDKEYHRSAFQTRADATINYIANNIIRSSDDSITSDSGEFVVSELARRAIVSELSYLDIPLAELIKIKDIGNHGFDFYSKNANEIILFGEAKYNSRQNAYGKSFEQIVRFEIEKQDSSDIIDIDLFFCNNSKTNFASGHKGFVAAFASKNTSTERLLKGIQANTDFQNLIKFNELICIAVNI